MRGRVAVIVNGRAGAAVQEAELRRALDVAGVDAVTHSIPPNVLVAPWITNIARDFDVLVAAGGDGTVSAVAAVAVELKKDLGVIPAGTLNHFAQDAGIPGDLDAALAVLAAGHTRRLD